MHTVNVISKSERKGQQHSQVVIKGVINKQSFSITKHLVHKPTNPPGMFFDKNQRAYKLI